MYKTIAIVAGIMMFSISVIAQETTSEFEHHANLVGNTLNCSAVETLEYNDYHGCKISDVYNLVDSCYIEIGDRKSIDTYHLAILSPDNYNGKAWSLFSDRLLLVRKWNGDTFIFDNVISNEPNIYDASGSNISDAPVVANCERFIFNDEGGSFNSYSDFELSYTGGQGYKCGWDIAIRIFDDNFYIVGLRVWEHDSGMSYSKHIAFEYENRVFPLFEFERSMIDKVRADENPWPNKGTYNLIVPTNPESFPND